MRRLALALLHHPVRDRGGATITTAVTNIDLHDMSRSSRSYGASDFFVVHPIAAQRELVEKVRDHWLEGSGSRRIPDRVPAMELMRVVTSIDEVYAALGGREAMELWTTSARVRSDAMTYARAREVLREPGKPVLIVFGTGWGLAEELEATADVRLEPIVSEVDSGFNHLSVRAACAITLDRLRGAR